MEVKSYEKVEYIKQKKPSPDINQVTLKNVGPYMACTSFMLQMFCFFRILVLG
jgi:hypothetical protein